MIRPEDVLLLGVALLAVVFFIGGAIDVFRVPVNPRRRRRRKPAPAVRGAPRTPLSFPFLMFPASLVCLALILGIFLFRGGGTLPVQPGRVPAESSLVQQANQLAARGEYEAAAQKYREAVERDPDDVSLRFALGTALSHAGRQEETREQFRWVVTRGNPSSLAVQAARRWLVSAGVLAEPGTFALSESLEQRPETTGKVKGMMEANDWDVEGRPRGVRIVLRGADEWNKGVVLETRVTLGEPYEFDRVPPGNYLLTAWVSETRRIWERKVTVEPGQETVLALTMVSRPDLKVLAKAANPSLKS
jgi:hypothetical protein